MDKDEMKKIDNYDFEAVGILPVLALRGLVVFPDSVIHFDVARSLSVEAVNAAMKDNQMMFVTTQKDPLKSRPAEEDLYEVGTIVKIVQTVRQTDNMIKIIVEGVCRGVALSISKGKNHFTAEIVSCKYNRQEASTEQIALMRMVKSVFEKYVELSPKIPNDIMFKVELSTDPDTLSDYVANNIIIDYNFKQQILATFDVSERLQLILEILNKETAVLEVQNKIAERAQQFMDDNQKEYFLHEQIRAIREELGEEDLDEEVVLYKNKIKCLRVDKKIKEQLLKECGRLQKMPEASQEAFTLRMYLDTCLELPWDKSSKDKIDINSVTKSLNKNHYGLEKVKERIIEYLAVRKLTPDVKGQIICLVGPPGVGKTSIAQSIATSINRKAERIALGGVHDEAEIRGHRRTYVAAMPGRVIAAIKAAGTNNPVLILDEIDKLAADYKGDPTSALLEVLDPEQNDTFRDHYIDLPFDLSRVMFITTANDMYSIPEPLKDRMEIIELGSYNREEKFHIAKKHLIPKQLENNGLTSDNFKITGSAIYALIDGYTREAGVRNLERNISALMRKVAKRVASGETDTVFKIDNKNIEEYLGPKKYKEDMLSSKNEVGLVNGLAWTAVGGETLPIEVAVVPGTGKIELTGSLGDVMKESAKIAVTCVRTRAEKLGIDIEFYKKNDIHIHAPEGAVPKDGPSAGITMTTAIVSALTDKPVNRLVAMTGEITLRGKVLPIGGLKEKTMGAYKMGIKTIVIPKQNESDLYEIDDVVKENVNIIPVETIDEVLEIAFDVDRTYEKQTSQKSGKGSKKSTKKTEKTEKTEKPNVDAVNLIGVSE